MSEKINGKSNKMSLCIAFSALAISFIALYINWQSFLFNNRPYIKIIPIKFENNDKFYLIKKLGLNNFLLSFKLQLKNLGRVPANDIHGESGIYWLLKKLKEEDMNNPQFKEILTKLKSAETGDFITIPEEQIDNANLKKVLEEVKNKDINVELLYKKWKSLSIFPGESFEFEICIRISGKDAAWAIENFEKLKDFRIELKVTYRGILPKVGRTYYSLYKATYENGEMIPCEMESY